jgi:3-hydroxyisobutyrate dehydrogenase
MRIALLGTGTMGAGMARNLLSAGQAVHVWNRTRERAEPLAADGAVVHDTPANALAGSDGLVTMLAHGDAVAAVVDGLSLDGVPWAQMSTVAVEQTGAFAARAPGTFVDAPVLGSKPGAESGELIVLASGAPDARDRFAPVFDAVGARTIDLGDEPGAGTRMKLVLNHWVVTLVEGLAETVLLAEGLELDPQAFLDIIDGGPMGPPYAKLKGANMVARSYEPNFSLKLAHKDAGLIAAAAEAAGIDLPLARVARERMGMAIEAGHGDDDFSATVEAGRRR